MAMQNRMQPQMRQPMPNQMPPTSNGPPGAQFANQRRRPMVSFEFWGFRAYGVKSTNSLTLASEQYARRRSATTVAIGSASKPANEHELRDATTTRFSTTAF